MTPNSPVPAGPAAQLEAQLYRWLAPTLAAQEAAVRGPARGRPPVLPAALLWLGLLVGVLRGVTSQRGIWRLLAVHGLWSLPRVPVGDQALYNRLQRTPARTWEDCFTLVTQALAGQLGD